MLIAYLPRQKILAEADFYNPAAPVPTNAPVATINLIVNRENISQNVQRLKLDV